MSKTIPYHAVLAKVQIYRRHQQFGKKKYFVSVFESGRRDLFSEIVLLMRHNLKLQKKGTFEHPLTRNMHHSIDTAKMRSTENFHTLTILLLKV